MGRMVNLDEALGRPPRVLVSCSAGMSSSLVARQLAREARARGLGWRIRCMGIEDAWTESEPFELLLLGPQVMYRAADLQRHFGSRVLVSRIEQGAYAFCDGEALVRQVDELLEEYARTRLPVLLTAPDSMGESDGIGGARYPQARFVSAHTGSQWGKSRVSVIRDANGAAHGKRRT